MIQPHAIAAIGSVGIIQVRGFIGLPPQDTFATASSSRFVVTIFSVLGTAKRMRAEIL
jgi:hypothetical protein